MFKTIFQPTALSACIGCLLMPVMVHAETTPGWEFGAVLDVANTSKELELGARGKDLQLGHSDLVARGALGSALNAEISAAVHTKDGDVETHLENAWVETKTLPAGLQARVGKFSSQIGYLNEQHPHADDFSERPLLYRGFLGGHWYDDGLRLNWTAPTPFYLRLGVETFMGEQLIKEAETKKSPGAYTFSMKTGADLNPSNSWQLGLSYLNNRRQAHAHEHGAEEEHDHAHGAQFSGQHLYMTDLVYKWAPDGNPKNNQVKLFWENARITGIHPELTSQRHTASSLGAVWRFHPAWELGLRSDELAVNKPEVHVGETEPEAAAARLRETTLMLAYKPSHSQTYRIQFSRQSSAGEAASEVFAHTASNVVQLQWVIGFGAHGAHSF